MNTLFLFGLLFPTNAVAQDSIDSHGFNLAPSDGDLHDGLSTWRGERNEPQSIGLNLLFEYASEPLTLHERVGDFESDIVLVDDLAALNVGGYYAPMRRLALTVSAPVYLSVDNLGGQTGVGLGDSHFAASVGVIQSKGQDLDFGLSLVPHVDVPGTYQGRNLRLESLAGGGVVAASLGNETWDVSTNLGAELTPEVDFYNLRGKERLITKVSGAYSLTEDVALRGEWLFKASLRNNQYNGTESPMEAIVSLRGHTDNNLGWTVGAAKSLNEGVSAATWRAFAGVDLVLNSRRDKDECPACPKVEEKPCPKEKKLVEVEGDKLVLLQPIYFDFDQATIRMPDSHQIMSALVDTMLEHQEIALLQVATGTDTRGSTEYNQDLSERRAKSVVDFLVSHGVEASRLTSTGFGETRLRVESCQVEECHELNRYSEFTIVQVKE